MFEKKYIHLLSITTIKIRYKMCSGGWEIYVSRKIGWGIHLRFKFKYPDLAPSSSKRSLYSPSSITLVSVNMHLPI